MAGGEILEFLFSKRTCQDLRIQEREKKKIVNAMCVRQSNR